MPRFPRVLTYVSLSIKIHNTMQRLTTYENIILASTKPMSNTTENDILLAINGMNNVRREILEYTFVREAIPRRDPHVIMMDIVRAEEQLRKIVTFSPLGSTYKIISSDPKKAVQLSKLIKILKEELNHVDQ